MGMNALSHVFAPQEDNQLGSWMFLSIGLESTI